MNYNFSWQSRIKVTFTSQYNEIVNYWQQLQVSYFQFSLTTYLTLSRWLFEGTNLQVTTIMKSFYLAKKKTSYFFPIFFPFYIMYVKRSYTNISFNFTIIKKSFYSAKKKQKCCYFAALKKSISLCANLWIKISLTHQWTYTRGHKASEESPVRAGLNPTIY